MCCSFLSPLAGTKAEKLKSKACQKKSSVRLEHRAQKRWRREKEGKIEHNQGSGSLMMQGLASHVNKFRLPPKPGRVAEGFQSRGMKC